MAQVLLQPVAVASDAKIRRQKTMGLVSVFLAYSSCFYILYTLNVAMPVIAADLDGLALFSWAISLPALAGAFVTLVFGKLSDMYGRRILLLISMSIFLVGTVLSALSTDFVILIIARTVLRLGQGAVIPLCFSVLGDMFPPAERSRWAGLLNIPSGIFALIGPTLGGWLSDTFSWRYIFWLGVPLLVLSTAVIFVGVPSLSQRAAHKIDVLGSVLLTIASSTMILGLSWAGTELPWASAQVIGLLGASVVFWALFVWNEGREAEPFLDPKVLKNRTFITAAVAGLMSLFGHTAILVYYPLFLQGVQGVTATASGHIVTPFGVLVAFMGVPAGFMLARTKRYKWMYVAGYAILTVNMFGMLFFKAETAVGWSVLVVSLAGLGLGAIPTVNTLVVQYAVPKRLLGMATGGIFFFVSMGLAMAPAVLGSAMNASYAETLKARLPAALNPAMDKAIMSSLSNPRVLLSPAAMTSLRETLEKTGGEGGALFEQTVAAVRASLAASLKTAFLIGAVMMLASFLLILTIPEISMDVEVQG